MAISKGIGDWKLLKNDRECEWIFSYLNQTNYVLLSPNAVTTEEQRLTIDNSVSKIENSIQKRLDFIKYVEDECRATLLPLEEFEWLNKKNTRLCTWAWCYLVNYYQMRVSVKSLNTTHLIKNIVSYFDVNLEMNNAEKSTLMSNIHKHWLEIFNKGEKFKWLSKKNISQNVWAWKYLHEKGVVPDFLRPIDDSQLYDAIVAVFDLWDVNDLLRRITLIDIKKAWNQKKYRENLDGKKAYNIIMKDEVKVKLDYLAEERNVKINEVLEALINQEHERLM